MRPHPYLDGDAVPRWGWWRRPDGGILPEPRGLLDSHSGTRGDESDPSPPSRKEPISVPPEDGHEDKRGSQRVGDTADGEAGEDVE